MWLNHFKICDKIIYYCVIFEFGQASHHKIWTNFQAQQSRRRHCRNRTAIVAAGTAVLSFSRTGMDGVTILRTGYDWIWMGLRSSYSCSLEHPNRFQVSLCVAAPFWSILCFFGYNWDYCIDNCNMWFVGSAINHGFQSPVQHEECKRYAAPS